MSYKGFKRLLGESSLERKSRFLLGAMTLLLISGSFWLYNWMNTGLAYDAIANSGRLLTSQILYNLHVSDPKAKEALAEYQKQVDDQWLEKSSLFTYKYRLYKPHSNSPEYKPDADEVEIIERLKNNPDFTEDKQFRPAVSNFVYYSAVRVTDKCLACHPRDVEKHELKSLKEGQLYAVMRIQLDNRVIEESIHLSRAVLISAALITSLLIMTGSYLIVRYVIVKPVKHLKEVSDAIANGYLNVRSEIQTGDEFEDLSFAFNRMIRNLLNKQDELIAKQTEINDAKTALDKKVDELARANLALFESNKLKGDFLTTMSHELRTPLHSILGFSDLLKQGDNFSDKQQRWVGNIRTSGAQLLDLINDILELARLEAGKMEVKAEPFAIAELIESAVGQIRPLAEKKDQELVIDVSSSAPPVRQDAGKLQQILSNLLSNAVKFTPERGRIEVVGRIEDDELVLVVRDNGLGIAPADQDAVFDKFRQSGSPLTREHEGTGLGLSIVRELSKLLGGDVTLESQPGQGSAFMIRVPRWLKSSTATESSMAGVLANGTLS